MLVGQRQLRRDRRGLLVLERGHQVDRDGAGEHPAGSSGISPPAPPAATDEVTLTTRGGHRLSLSDSGDAVSVSHPAGSSVKLDATGQIEFTASSAIRLTASRVEIGAGMIEFQAGAVHATGLVRCETLVATSVIASSYSPGAGNIL
jgi:hypothetical protein